MHIRQQVPVLPILLFLTAAVLFSYNVQQHYFLGDDSFISFRYARQLVLGHGLVWNEGYRVEGYTNFLWVLLIAGGMQLGFEPEWFAPAVSIAAGAGVMLMFFGWLVRQHGVRSVSVWVPIFTLCMSRSFTGWVTGGLETMFHVFLIIAGVLLIVRAHSEQERLPWGSAILFSLATLTRPDSIVFAFTAGCALLADSIFGRRPLKTVVFWTMLYFLPVLLHVAWRYSYYGFFLPNTFYAKVAGVWFEQAYNYFYLFNRYYNFVWFVPFVLLGGFFSPVRYAARYFLFLTAVYLLYVCYVGGDRFEFRFLVVVFPLVYWLLIEGAKVFCYRVTAVVLGKKVQHVLLAAVIIALFGTTIAGSIGDVPKPERFGISALRGIEKYASSRTEQGLFLKRLIDEGYYPPDLPLALGGAGAVPYYTMLPVLDRRGLNNIEIAHMPIEERGRIAHEHDVPIEYLYEKKIAVFDILNRLKHDTLFRLNVKKYHHDGHRVQMRALKSPYGYVIFATFVSDEELRELFPRMELILPDWEQKLLEEQQQKEAEEKQAEAALAESNDEGGEEQEKAASDAAAPNE